MRVSQEMIGDLLLFALATGNFKTGSSEALLGRSGGLWRVAINRAENVLLGLSQRFMPIVIVQAASRGHEGGQCLF
jgi:hypothetical protein